MSSSTQFRVALLEQATTACTVLTRQTDILLELVDFYVKSRRGPFVPADNVKTKELLQAVDDMGSLPNQLALTVVKWKQYEEPALSKLGVELYILNELLVTLEVTMLFFIRENVNLGEFSFSDVKRAHADLVRCNKLL